jgi:hypothetical protein
MTLLGLKESLNCLICTPLWISMILSALNIFFLPQMGITPSLVIFGEPAGWMEYAGSIFMDSFSVASMVYLTDQFNSYFLEQRSNLNITVHNENKDENKDNMLLD